MKFVRPLKLGRRGLEFRHHPTEFQLFNAALKSGDQFYLQNSNDC